MIPLHIWIINEYAGTPYYGMEFRHYYLGKELVKKGYSVTIISSSYSHLFQHLPQNKKENIDGIEYLWLKTFNYGLSQDKKRVIKWLLFMFKVFSLPFRLKRPNIIIVSPMAPFTILPAYFLSIMYRSRLIYEVKDIWPLSLIELGRFSIRHPFIKFMGWFEKFALNKSDIIVSNLQNYGEHIKKDIGIDRKFEWISNGIDLEELKHSVPLDHNLIKQIPKDKFIIGYTGSIGVANAMYYYCNSAKLLINNDNICFVVVGDGQEKDKLLKEFGDLNNLLFIDSIPKKQVHSMLSLFDICFIGWNDNNIYHYGTSANKIFDYMYSRKPILNSFSGNGDIVQIANCGISVEAQNTQAISDGIMKLYSMTKEERDILGKNGRDYILKNFTYEKLAKKYIELFKE